MPYGLGQMVLRATAGNTLESQKTFTLRVVEQFHAATAWAVRRPASAA